MPESFVQLPADGVGKKLRTWQKTIGANTVEEQAVFLSAKETWSAVADNVVPAANKYHIAIFNALASGRIIRVRKLFAINTTTAAVTGALMRCEGRRTTVQAAGTAITPVAHDTNNAALPGGIAVATGATITDGSLLWPLMLASEEQVATAPSDKNVFLQGLNLMMEGPETQELVLREGQGFGLKQVTNVTVGTWTWVLVFTVEAP